VNNKRFGVQIDNHIHWKKRIDEMIPKLSGACGAVWSMVRINKINTVRSIYYARVHSIIRYGKFLGGNSSSSGKIFTVQKKVFRIMAGTQPEPHVAIYLSN
jgi:hypothetical protein